MTYAQQIGVMFFAWFAGHCLGYQVRQIADALSAA